MSGTRVKICGITNVEDAQAVVSAGAHALGLVFYEASPRAVDLEQAQAIAYAAGPFISVTALFVNPPSLLVGTVVSKVPVQLLQFHGDETAAFCESFQRPYIKAIRMRPDLDLDGVIASHPNASGFLLDAYRPGVPGGTGETFDWGRVPRRSKAPIILAGGLTPENVADAIRATGVYGVDVSGGVESAPGKKDHNQIKSFINNVRSALV